MVEEVDEILSDGVGGALIPGGVGEGLLGCGELDETAGEVIELIGLRDVAMQGSGVKLGEQVDTLEPGVDAVGDRDIDETVLRGERDGWLGPLFGQGKQACSLASTHNDGQYIFNGGRCPLR